MIVLEDFPIGQGYSGGVHTPYRHAQQRRLRRMGVKDHGALANVKTVLQQPVLIEQCRSEGSSIGERDVAPSKIAQAMDVTLAGSDDDAADAVGFSGARDDRVSETF